MADGGNVVEGEVDEDEPATMSYPLITVSDLPSSTTAGISTLLPLQLIIILIIFMCFTFTPFILIAKITLKLQMHAVRFLAHQIDRH